MLFFTRKELKRSEPWECSASKQEETESVEKHSCCTFNTDDEIKRVQKLIDSEN